MNFPAPQTPADHIRIFCMTNPDIAGLLIAIAAGALAIGLATLCAPGAISALDQLQLHVLNMLSNLVAPLAA